jgi:hypothetical protein
MASALSSAPLVECDDCRDLIESGEVVILDGVPACAPCALTAAAHTLSALLYPGWSPLPSSLRSAEESLRAIRPLLARVESRVREERRKQTGGVAELLAPRPSHERAIPEEA